MNTTITEGQCSFMSRSRRRRKQRLLPLSTIYQSLFVILLILTYTSANSSSSEDDDISQRYYNTLSDFPLDENNKLSTHLLLYPQGQCAELIESHFQSDPPYGRLLRGIPPDLQRLFHFPSIIYSSSSSSSESSSSSSSGLSLRDCPAVCIEKGIDHKLLPHHLPNFMYDGNGNDIRSLVDFVIHECQKVEYGFVSYYNKGLDVYWIDFEGERNYRFTLMPMEQKTNFIHTFLGHRFLVVDPDTRSNSTGVLDDDNNEETPTEQIVVDLTVEHLGLLTINDHETKLETRDISSAVRTTLQNEWERHLRVKRIFTPLGFHRGRLPDDLWGSISTYYYNNRYSVVNEEWGGKGLFVNYWEADVRMIQIPVHLKRVWQSRLRLLVEDWIGIELENTDIYGMREYTDGARLLTHVDREATHAASLIINVHQEGLNKPWTLNIHDHADRMHEVLMEPGDIVYYESAKCLHGRNKALDGGFFVNLFAHYRPVGDDRWYLKENQEVTSRNQPLMDVGECVLDGGEEDYSVGAVKCDKYVGLHMSPTLFKAKSGDDLFRWWKKVGPGGDQYHSVYDVPLHDSHQPIQEQQSEQQEHESQHHPNGEL